MGSLRLEEGVTEGWLYLWSGEPGPARSVKAAALVDGEGVVCIVPTGEPEDVTVVASVYRDRPGWQEEWQ